MMTTMFILFIYSVTSGDESGEPAAADATIRSPHHLDALGSNPARSPFHQFHSGPAG
jgi:hypothetical protein